MLYNANSEEQKIIEFWKKNKIFERSVAERPAEKPYAFYDGPPFATGTPHYGHLVGSTMKDIVPRFWTMKGYRVERRWGWDCHGLPIENIVEKELGISTKKELEEKIGVARFNSLCRERVLGYVDEWCTVIERLGRWVDMDHAYRTMDRPYMESVWWVFKQLFDKGYLYESFRSMHICPRCETTLSQSEVTEGYKEVKDISVVAKFKITNAKEKLGLDGDVYALAWTTTPWTLPGNVALAVGSEHAYFLLRPKNEFSHGVVNGCFVLAKEVYEKWKKETEGLFYAFKNSGAISDPVDSVKMLIGHGSEIVKEMVGSELINLTYEPLFPYYKDTLNAFRIVTSDHVTTDAGTGIVHIAPAFGEDDFKVGVREKIPLVQHVGMDGRFKSEVTDFAGEPVKPRGEDKERLATDIKILRYLQEHGTFFSKENIVHTYPHCWRCDTPLLNYATSSWFVDVTKLKPRLLETAKNISWSPENMREGRFGKWLEGARDWSISRQRFWASVIPVWRCENQIPGKRGSVQKCGRTIVFGSVAELEQASGKQISDLHKDVVDQITIPCRVEDRGCGGTMKRIPDVLDTWFDSGSMPYAQVHYPFENKEKFEKSFPAEYIGEGQDQTRAWFYYLHVLAGAIMDKQAFNHVIVNGIVLAEDGKKMSKKLKNYPDPSIVMEKYGADALRFYLASSPVVHAENLNFSEEGVKETYGKLVNTFWNVYEFYELAADTEHYGPEHKSTHVLDKWILAKLHMTTKEVSENLEGYRLAEAARPIIAFVTELSQWYVRRSRERLKGDDMKDKQGALHTLRLVLLTTSKLLAPFTPFVAETIYQRLRTSDFGLRTSSDSVHLADWPHHKDIEKEDGILERMEEIRKIVELGLALRAEKKLKVRQPLAELRMNRKQLSQEYLDIVADELNVKKVAFAEAVTEDFWATKIESETSVWLDPRVTEELKEEGMVRDIVRAINQLRKDQGLTPKDKIKIVYATDSVVLKAVCLARGHEILADTLAIEFMAGDCTTGPLKIGDSEMRLFIERI
jgi:isoleucyl-tRNA synthetase